MSSTSEELVTVESAGEANLSEHYLSVKEYSDSTANKTGDQGLAPAVEKFNTGNCAVSSVVSEENSPCMSKSQRKKMMRKQRWQELKVEKREEKKLKKKQKREKKRALGGDMGPSKKMLKMNTIKDSKCRVKVVLDCSFDDLMVERDIRKLGQQIQFCYSSNRRATHPLQLYLTSVGGKTQERLERIGDYHSWDVHIRHHFYQDEFLTKESIIYLTSDSPNILQELQDDKVYVIGALVDHNHHKGLCYQLAQKHGIGHAQLPIGEYVQLCSRKVLTVNHVFEILLRFTETGNWEESFHRVIPRRKQLGESRCERKLKSKLKDDAGHSEDEKQKDLDESKCSSDNSDADEQGVVNDTYVTPGEKCAEIFCNKSATVTNSKTTVERS